MGCLGQDALAFGDVWPGLIVALADGLRARSRWNDKRPGSLQELRALAGGRPSSGIGSLEIVGDTIG